MTEQQFDEAKLGEAVEAFQDSYSDQSWEEYGISWDDAAKGLLVALETLGFVVAADAESIRKAWAERSAEEARKNAEYEAARRAKLTPEQREREDEMRESMLRNTELMMEMAGETIFKTNHLFDYLRDKAHGTD